MTGAERQALRDKHHRDQYGLCAGCGSRTLDGGTSTIEWKFCDVIRVLDATENLKSSDRETEVKCDHQRGSWEIVAIHKGEPEREYRKFTFCPKCGEKL